MANPNKDMEVSNPPDDSISSATVQQNFLIGGSWENNVRCWEIDNMGKSIPKSQQTMQASSFHKKGFFFTIVFQRPQGPVLDVCWHDDGSKVFMAGCDKQVKLWDLATNQAVQVAAQWHTRRLSRTFAGSRRRSTRCYTSS